MPCRRSKDYTYIYGKDATEGALTPFIANQFREDVDECVLCFVERLSRADGRSTFTRTAASSSLSHLDLAFSLCADKFLHSVA